MFLFVLCGVVMQQLAKVSIEYIYVMEIFI